MEKLKKIRLTTTQLLATGFLGIILLGGILLWLPISNTRPISLIDALFTAVTSVCVTGLVTVTPAVQFTLFGKIVLLILIQIGGLGIIACVTAFFIIMKRRISLKERVVILEAYSMESLSGMVAMILRILKGTICLEGIGALLYSFRFVPEFGVVKGIGYSVFHAVSAFCNAGIDILGDSSFIPYADSVVVNFTTILLVVLSGLGFTVWQDLGQNLKKVWKKELELRRLFKKLRLHSKIVLIMTSVLIVSGTLAFLLLEYNNPGTIGDMSFGEKLMSSLFHSVSTRTAGFATVPQGELTQGTMFTTCILMFIGGSPGGTAGGVKTTTIAMLILCCVSVLQNKKDVECFGRRIQADNIRTGICVVILAFVSLLAGTTLLTIFEGDVDFIRIMYETTSAIGTVGLSADLTSQLCTASKFVIMVLMYIGRLGPITFALAFGTGRKSKNHIRQLPVQGILIG
ncbi:potassium transporter KtrB [bacterium]|uniref:TrkH family potassium uptake protein n=1 Tax=unclassified Bariatricus TaxID=2677046 RepID=UPI002A25086B|nr:potassium transporter KtrB [bacterium]MDD6514313.1 potassium transporter TrkG [bacterium]MDY2886948.1 potassium transporter TrkG [Bariatricus sp.]MDY4195572.1 potassium transporter TrkG [Bariatricus sp.]MDY4503398.1 potassium transporter TrkG [Bariatricus sp.]